jgi:hypothetical protein
MIVDAKHLKKRDYIKKKEDNLVRLEWSWTSLSKMMIATTGALTTENKKLAIVSSMRARNCLQKLAGAV